jgi:hypothetical protein
MGSGWIVDGFHFDLVMIGVVALVALAVVLTGNWPRFEEEDDELEERRRDRRRRERSRRRVIPPESPQDREEE